MFCTVLKTNSVQQLSIVLHVYFQTQFLQNTYIVVQYCT